MPLYEFGCQSCGHKFEELKSLSESNDDATCPNCGQQAQREMSAFAVGGSSRGGGGHSCAPSGGG